MICHAAVTVDIDPTVTARSMKSTHPIGHHRERQRRDHRRERPIASTAVVVMATHFHLRSLILLLLLPIATGCERPEPPQQPESTVTFGEHIKPLLQTHCAPCHRPGEAAPFPLESYADARKRARQIVEVTQSGYMPPWLPDDANPRFIGDRRLSPGEIERLARWVDQGALEGPNETTRASAPGNDSGWRLGDPDLVVDTGEPYMLDADGPDIYRNFVIPVPADANRANRFVRAVEFKPGNARVVHHAFLFIDETSSSRHADDADAAPGFDGMVFNGDAVMPEGHFLGWQPGRMPRETPPDMAWTLPSGADLVLQLHLTPTGKREPVDCRIGLHFSETPAKTRSVIVGVSTRVFEIPAGNPDFVVEDTMTLPIDVFLLSVLPHTHYLGKTLLGRATLPDGTQTNLIHIPSWDFNWQGDYAYQTPIFLPKGTGLSMRFHFDNSSANPANPHHPPRTVRYGTQSSDEMAELWFQAVPARPTELAQLQAAADAKRLRVLHDQARSDLRRNPDDVDAHVLLGKLYLADRQPDPAIHHLKLALAGDPDHADAHYFLGIQCRAAGDLEQATAHLTAAVKAQPTHAKAHGNLGLIYTQKNDPDRAVHHFRMALEHNPKDSIAREFLERLGRP